MDTTLFKYLEKCGVKGVNDLTELERHDFDEWQKILSATTTIEDIIKFLKVEVEILNRDLREAVKKEEQRAALLITARLENYEALLAITEGPENAKKELRATIEAKL